MLGPPLGCEVAFTWHLWNECNRRFKEGETHSVEVVAHEFLRDVNLLFDLGKFKTPYKFRLEGEAVNAWKELLPYLN